MVSPPEADKTQEGRLELMDLASTSECLFPAMGEEEDWGGFQDSASFSTTYFF